MPRAVVIPPGVKHYYLRLESSVKLRRLTPATASKPRPAGRLTLKQKRVKRDQARKAAARAPKDGEAHPLLVRAAEGVRALRPSSSLLFLCRSSGLTVRRAARELRELGLPAVPLHEAIGLEHAAPADLLSSANSDDAVEVQSTSAAGAAEVAESPRTRRERLAERALAERGPSRPSDTSAALQLRHKQVSAAFSSRLGAFQGLSEAGTAEGDGDGDGKSEGAEDSPLLVTFEDMARGLHFDAVEAVFIVGLPDSPATYLHLAGRTGRQPVLKGTVVTICPGQSHEQLLGWANRLGGIAIQPLPYGDDDSDNDPEKGEAEEAVDDEDAAVPHL